ncbi:hypothetical protein CK497_10565 [Vreelandella alkaliphila]|uniref:Uncharacterized protein n=1 Tax=Vreelandella alkaliphila TaxID=272774 RepID=A0ABX4HI80_9GAMM|nr:hypothetical protein CK497_10565 [Halomonas humidisoli]
MNSTKTVPLEVNAVASPPLGNLGNQAIVNKLANQRQPPSQRAKKAKPANLQQLLLFDEGGLEDR